MIPRLLSAFVLSAALPAYAEEGFVSLFNGKDLDGWVNVNCAPGTWGVKDGVITCTGIPTGGLRTTRHYENFIFEVEWRHLRSGGNAGIFVWAGPIAAPGVPFLRAIEVQVLDHGYGNTENYTTHGDVFPIHGSTMIPFGRHRGMRSFPSENRSKPSPEWNHYRIVANDGVLRLSVNGKEVSGGEKCVWRKGYLALESEGAPTEWRNLRIKELPSTNPKPEETAPEAQNHRPLYTGVDLAGWKTESPDRWKPSDWRLVVPEGTAASPLITEAEFGDAEFILDCRIPKAGENPIAPAIFLRGRDTAEYRIPLKPTAAGKWQRFIIITKGRSVTIRSGEKETTRELPADAPAKGTLGIIDPGAALEFANFYVRDL